MGNVIGLFANRAQHGIVLVETFSVSQRVSTPFEGSHAQNIFAPNGLESFCPCIPQFAFLKAPTGVCGVWVDSCIGKWRIIRERAVLQILIKMCRQSAAATWANQLHPASAKDSTGCSRSKDFRLFCKLFQSTCM